MSSNAKINPSHPRCLIQDQSGSRSSQRSQNTRSTQQRIWYSCPANHRLEEAGTQWNTYSFRGWCQQTFAEQRETIEAPLFQQIGQLKFENDWLKKKLRRTNT